MLRKFYKFEHTIFSMDTDILEDLGLTRSEVKTYVTLLELGVSSAGKIIQQSRQQNSAVHRSLKSLVQRGLVSYIMKGKHKLYSATEPEYFLKFIDEKKNRFESLLPKLKEKQKQQKEKTQTSMFVGKKGILEVYKKLLSVSGKEMITFGGSKETSDFMGLTLWMNIYRKRIANKLPLRHLASDEVKDTIADFTKMNLTTIRFLPKEHFSQFQETAIVGDYVAISVFADEGYSILIHNKRVADGYRKNFEMLWKQAKK